jgi:hypothetical protein
VVLAPDVPVSPEVLPHPAIRIAAAITGRATRLMDVFS